MSDTDQKREDEVLQRMLATKPKPHKMNFSAGPRLSGRAEPTPHQVNRL